MFLNTGSLFLRKSGSLTRLGECEGGCLWSIPAIPVCFCFSNGFHCDPVHSLNHAPMIFSNVPLDLPEQFEPVCGIVPWKAIRPFHRTFIIVYHSNMYRYISDIFWLFLNLNSWRLLAGKGSFWRTLWEKTRKVRKIPKNRISGEGRRPDMNVLEYHSSDVDAK